MERTEARRKALSLGIAFRLWIRRRGLSALGLALLFGLPFLLSGFFGEPVETGWPKFIQGLLIRVYLMAVYAMSYDLLMGYAGILSFGHALFFGGGAYITGILLKHFHASLGIALLAAVLLALGLGGLMGLLSMRVRGVYLAMITLALAQAAFILSEATDFRQYTGAEDGLHGIPVPTWLDPAEYRLRFYYFTLLFMLGAYFMARRLVDSPTGRVWVALRENEERAVSLGYSPFMFRLLAFMFSGAFAALAGSLNALLNKNVTPSLLSVSTTIQALLMTLVGGVGTLSGPMFGAALLELTGYLFNRIFGPIWFLLFGLLYILVVLAFPYGLVGVWRLRAHLRRIFLEII
ncbi:branched-chain amino acid ABC transporter permease [Thermoflexus sp.]|uniref:branched-chain amino acid ABC transporter permease n=1 Tax=Thermoflexus sp. TaxID=1969742 RepID=UPI0035E42D08